MMRFQTRFRLIAAPILASAMMVTMGGCFYGGHEDHRGYDRGHDRGYQHDDDDRDEGTRSTPAVNNPSATVTAATINAPAKVALVLRHPAGQW
jgi:hypothetical protein